LAFDYPQPFSTVGRRGTTNVPAQALALLNNPLVHEQARHWAERTLAAGSSDDRGRIERMYAEAFARPPTAEEAASATAFLADRRARGAAEQEAWADLGHVLFNVKEFIFVR
jgi:hypothetical protein